MKCKNITGLPVLWVFHQITLKSIACASVSMLTQIENADGLETVVNKKKTR